MEEEDFVENSHIRQLPDIPHPRTDESFLFGGQVRESAGRSIHLAGE